jgi:hypothetical protein
MPKNFVALLILIIAMKEKNIIVEKIGVPFILL